MGDNEKEKIEKTEITSLRKTEDADNTKDILEMAKKIAFELVQKGYLIIEFSYPVKESDRQFVETTATIKYKKG